MLPKKKAIAIVAGSPNKKVFDTLFKSLHSMGQFNTVYFENGYDAIIHCSGSLPDILILDEKLRHVSLKDIIKSLRQLDTHKKLKILMILKTNDPLKIDDWGADSYLFWDVLACQAPDRQHEQIAFTIGGLLGDDDLIDHYKETL